MIHTHINVFINELDMAAKEAVTAVSRVRTSFDTLVSRYGTGLEARERKAVQEAHDTAVKAVEDLKREIDKIRAKYEPEVAAALEADATEVKDDIAIATDASTDKKAAKKS